MSAKKLNVLINFPNSNEGENKIGNGYLDFLKANEIDKHCNLLKILTINEGMKANEGKIANEYVDYILDLIKKADIVVNDISTKDLDTIFIASVVLTSKNKKIININTSIHGVFNTSMLLEMLVVKNDINTINNYPVSVEVLKQEIKENEKQ